MKSFFSRVVNSLKLKTTRGLPRADVDCSDFVTTRPEAPSVMRLRQVVYKRRYGGQHSTTATAANSTAKTAAEETESTYTNTDENHNTTHINTSTAESLRREASVRSSVFDLMYRCGGNGRCVENDHLCRFPCCFTMRPITKGAEVLAERLAYEVDDAPTPQIRAIVQLAKAEELEKAVNSIQHLVDAQIQAAAGGRVLLSALRQQESVEQRQQEEQRHLQKDYEHTFSPAAAKYGSESAAEGVNPLLENETLRNEVISLYLWRAVLLVNMRADERAVNSLLNLAPLVPQQDRVKLYTAAATWAVLNDMEVVYYRSLLQQYASFPTAETFAHHRPLLLQRVLTACEELPYFVECATHIVFAKEVTATVSRAQSAQMHGDFTEDPMKSLCIPLALRYYRFHITDTFWSHFLRLLCMPPIPAPTTEAESGRDPAEQLGLTPNYVLDAVGRSMLLHHLAMLHEARENEISSGAVAKSVQQLKAAEGEAAVVHPSQYERVLTDRERGVVVTRLRELLMHVRSYETREKSLREGENAGEKGGRLTGMNTTPEGKETGTAGTSAAPGTHAGMTSASSDGEGKSSP